MVKIYYGKNNIDLAGFMFEEAKKMMNEGCSGALILVPDRYTLETERKAFSALKAGGLMDIEIMSFSRMAAKLLPRSEGVKYIDDLSRAMILRKVISGKRDELRVFARAAGKTDFVRMMGDTIQDFKQFRTGPEALDETALGGSDGRAEASGDADAAGAHGTAQAGSGMLGRKLREIKLIYEAYEDEIRGKFYDTEDFLERLCKEIRRSDDLAGKAVFVHGFDFFSARLVSVMEALAQKCGNLTVILTAANTGDPDYGLFAPVDRTIEEIQDLAKRSGEKGYYLVAIPETFCRDQNEEIAHLGRNIYAFPKERFYNDTPEDITAYSCDTRETETVLAARIIKDLVKNHGYRFKDIGVAVSDLSSRAGLIRRIFEREGIKYFDNSKYTAADNRYMQFILALCSLEKGYGRGEDLMRIAGTGVFGISHDEKEVLENYAYKYKIENYQWQRPFYKIDRRRKKPGEAEAELAEAERIRASFVGQVEAVFEALADCRTGGEFGEKLFAYLRDELRLEEIITADSDRLKASGRPEIGEATLQLWEKTRAIFERLKLLLGTYACDREEFFEILKAGVESLELGLIPAAVDNVIVAGPEEFGAGEYKAVIFMGFTNGLVPGSGKNAGILSERDKASLNSIAGRQLIGLSDRAEKEKLEIYRTLTAPGQKLFLSWSESDDSNEGAAGPSPLFDGVKKIFPGIGVFKITEADAGTGTTAASKEAQNGRRWSGEREYLTAGTRSGLFPEAVVSPTSLETYAHCPFAHFMRYGIRADERKVFEASAPEMGTVFHDIIMKFSENLTENELWQTVGEEEVRKIVGEIAEESVAEFAEGQLFEGAEGEYRISRIRSVCEKTAGMVAAHVRSGSFTDFLFEAPFGRNRAIPPVELKLNDGSKVLVEGRIDRIDIADTPEGSCVKVIDYKSGNQKIDEKEIRGGYRFQLMLYMMAAQEGLKKVKPEIVPAGVFYFKIKEPVLEMKGPDKVSNRSDSVETKLKKEYKMDGIVVQEPWIVEALDREMADEDYHDYSKVVKLRRYVSGEVRGTGSFSALSLDEFNALMNGVRAKAEAAAGKMMDGDVTVDPMKIAKTANACDFCSFHSICTVDTKPFR